MATEKVTQTATKIIQLLQKLPKDRVRHNATFKTSQIERFCHVGGIPVPKSILEEKKVAAEERHKATQIDTKKIKEVVFGPEDEVVDYQENLFTEEILQQQYKSLRNLAESKWSKYYQIDDKLLTPKGNPNYYTSLMKDLNQGGQVKAPLSKAIKVIMTGKY